jgi:CheY-like chemotaxis protein
LFRQSPEKFDLVITDMTMPQMTGDVLARELISIRPDIPIIICTGYSDRIDTDIANDIGIRELLMKPVVMKDIAQCIRRVLDEGTSQAGPSSSFKRG